MKKNNWLNIFKKEPEKGSSFVEVMFSVAILTTVIVGIIGMFANCNILISNIRQSSIAQAALNEQMEVVRGLDYATIIGLGTSFTASGFSQLSSATGTMTLEDTFSDANIRRVTLTVSWTSGTGRAMSKTMAALVSNGGID